MELVRAQRASDHRASAWAARGAAGRPSVSELGPEPAQPVRAFPTERARSELMAAATRQCHGEMLDRHAAHRGAAMEIVYARGRRGEQIAPRGGLRRRGILGRLTSARRVRRTVELMLKMANARPQPESRPCSHPTPQVGTGPPERAAVTNVESAHIRGWCASGMARVARVQRSAGTRKRRRPRHKLGRRRPRAPKCWLATKTVGVAREPPLALAAPSLQPSLHRGTRRGSAGDRFAVRGSPPHSTQHHAAAEERSGERATRRRGHPTAAQLQRARLDLAGWKPATLEARPSASAARGAPSARRPPRKGERGGVGRGFTARASPWRRAAAEADNVRRVERPDVLGAAVGCCATSRAAEKALRPVGLGASAARAVSPPPAPRPHQPPPCRAEPVASAGRSARAERHAGARLREERVAAAAGARGWP